MTFQPISHSTHHVKLLRWHKRKVKEAIYIRRYVRDQETVSLIFLSALNTKFESPLYVGPK